MSTEAIAAVVLLALMVGPTLVALSTQRTAVAYSMIAVDVMLLAFLLLIVL